MTLQWTYGYERTELSARANAACNQRPQSTHVIITLLLSVMFTYFFWNSMSEE